MVDSKYEEGYNAGYADGFQRAREQYKNELAYRENMAAAKARNQEHVTEMVGYLVRDNAHAALIDALCTGTGWYNQMAPTVETPACGHCVSPRLCKEFGVCK